jgi:2-C-methyl-D-erythritol 4-phosphate cytidylyltransferase / 2-C-methyl-D-erythritol 2,4-cyclodiphosphate synthase
MANSLNINKGCAKVYKTIALIVAAGEGRRLSSDIPKQYIKVSDKSLLTRTINQFAEHPLIDAVIVGIHPDYVQQYNDSVQGIEGVLPYVIGGKRRQDTVYNVLKSLLPYNPNNVLIHDAARAFIKADTITNIVKALGGDCDAVLAATKVADTLKYAKNKMIEKNMPRDDLFLAQTPQGFDYQLIYDLYQKHNHIDFTDDVSLVEHDGGQVKIIESPLSNFKITTSEDLIFAERILKNNIKTRVGSGFDAHKFIAPKKGAKTTITLCGVKIPCPYEVIAHSDGDVALHALTDALLGAIGSGDIGMHFPPSDSKWKDASSDQFIKFAKDLIAKKGGVINNVDITIISQVPKISPYREKFTQQLSKILDIPKDAINIKATTTEGMGFTGREEGIACQVVVSVEIK